MTAERVTLGGDLTVRRLGLGTMELTGRGTWGEPRDPAGARALLRRARELGVELFDTADSYGPEVSERLVADALHPYGGIVVATKGGLTRQGPSLWSRNCRPGHLRSSCEGSLRRLRVDCIDLYQLHAVDPRVPVEESLGALAELQQQGKIRHIGVCNVGLAQLERALVAAAVVSVQNRYNAADRRSEAVLERCEQLGIAFVPWAPLDGGSLSGVRGRLGRIARRHGATDAQIALTWLLHRSPLVVPIPGTRSVEHLEENLGAASLELGPEDLAALASPVRAGLSARRLARGARMRARRLRRSFYARRV
jgi:aryl-alcohol dehydrogenase-like predicted oxidoreductase